MGLTRPLDALLKRDACSRAARLGRSVRVATARVHSSLIHHKVRRCRTPFHFTTDHGAQNFLSAQCLRLVLEFPGKTERTRTGGPERQPERINKLFTYAAIQPVHGKRIDQTPRAVPSRRPAPKLTRAVCSHNAATAGQGSGPMLPCSSFVLHPAGQHIPYPILSLLLHATHHSKTCPTATSTCDCSLP